MLSGNGTIDYSVEAHTLDAHKTSGFCVGFMTWHLHGGSQHNLQQFQG